MTAQVGGDPLANISVNVYASLDDYANGNQAASTQTDSNGTYDVGSLPVGSSYLVEFRDDPNGDYATQYYDAKSTIDAADPVAVDRRHCPRPASTLCWPPRLHITGTVTRADDGIPGDASLGHFNVWVLAPDGSGGWRFAGSSPVEDNGSYDVGGLAAGSYRVSFGDISGDYLGQYYNDKSTIDAADPVTILHAGDTMPTH